jgi:two-component system, chemotaxis family, protein-glutamate methylesterase/glutaminase
MKVFFPERAVVCEPNLVLVCQAWRVPGRRPGSGEPVEPHDVVVVGGSAGSLEPLRRLAAGLPPALPAAVAVTIHVREHARSQLPAILDRAGPLPAAHARTGEPLRPGRVYVAPPGCHLLMPAGVVELSNGPRMSRTRPAVDAMFASAARWFGDRVVAVVLSGMLDDGAAGAALVEQAGGRVIVQDPAEAEQPSMPRAALAAACTGIALPGAELGQAAAAMLGHSGLANWPRTTPQHAAKWAADLADAVRTQMGDPPNRVPRPRHAAQ